MKKLSIITSILCMLSTLFVAAQSGKNIKVTGTVVDEDTNEPIMYATLVLENAETKDVTGGVTDMDGKFSVDAPQGTYNMRIEFISYKTYRFPQQELTSDKNLGTIKLALDVAELDAVEVTGERTSVEIKLDKKIYNIGKDLTTQGGTVSDALQNIPSVSVDVEGAVSLRGNENVRILINGKPSAMAGYGDTNIFSQLPADAIERVEVITSSSARYDAEGTAGILNIILKKEKTLGLNGSIQGTVGAPDNHSLSANINLRTNKFNLFTTTGAYYRNSPGEANYDNNYETGSFDRIRENRDYERLRKGFNTNLGIEYYLTEKSSLTGSVFGRWGENDDESNTINDRYIGTDLNSITSRIQNEGQTSETYQGSLNYINNFNDEGHKLTADLQYSYDNEDQPTTINEYRTFPSDSLIDRQNIFQVEKQNEFLFQADYVLPKGDSQFEAGVRINLETEDTGYNLDQFNQETNEFEVDELLSYNFDYDQNVYAAYTQYGNKLSKKFSYLLGLRLENTQMKGSVSSPYYTQEELIDELDFDFDANFDKNYLSLFPTMNLIYEIAENENLTLGYNRRINRPRGWFINPFPSRSSRTNIFQGNPDLDPAFSNAFDLGYLKRWTKFTLNASVYFQRETNSFERIQDETGQTTDDGISIIRSIPVNLSSQNRIGGELGAMLNPTDWFRFNASFNFFKFKTEGFFNDVDYGAESTSWFGRFSGKVTLPAKIDFQANGFYMGPRKNSQTESEGMFSLDTALSKELIKNSLTATFNVRDVFNSRKRRSYTVSENFTSDSEFQWRKRQFTLSLIYKFNQQNDHNNRNKNQGNPNGGDDMDFEG
ncbi:Outer membrane receptor proteins, mostly Fe transport [Pustulibacterium marinum]|uniref:Outer membrane receptor proteins, mostly Fe transport n=1 Tax=Pustulibacterium marinum TaxID=1224947 RepID=A0A1I7IFT4_9FLAO|nr:TonB-dependent receptor [Pustulibacterium marinum]SFU71789.1 Outer membrane receptor proteins, mostly Fe transport [Pustulibacterium marinum]